MASILRLGISGIRSFEPHEEASEVARIDFVPPLTIILGNNGAGKTTIIECLKAATTGTYPSNSSSGQSFVIDPGVVGRDHVTAQIRLLFRNTAGHKMSLCRTFSVKRERTRKLRFKAENQWASTRNANGESVSMDKTCADINRLMPEWLGVSKAILESVIFVHQEESNWPLEDSKTLKDKFDAIFAATRYSKAIVKLAELAKQYNAQHKEVDGNLKALLERRKIKDEKRNELARMLQQIDTAGAKVTALGEREQEAQAEVDRIEAVLRANSERAAKVAELEARAVTAREEVRLAEAELRVPYNDSDEDLQRAIDNFKDSVAENAREAASLEAKIATLRTAHGEATARLARDEAELRGFLAETAQRRAKLAACDDLVDELVAKYDLKVPTRAASSARGSAKRKLSSPGSGSAARKKKGPRGLMDTTTDDDENDDDDGDGDGNGDGDDVDDNGGDGDGDGDQHRAEADARAQAAIDALARLVADLGAEADTVQRQVDAELRAANSALDTAVAEHSRALAEVGVRKDGALAGETRKTEIERALSAAGTISTRVKSAEEEVATAAQRRDAAREAEAKTQSEVDAAADRERAAELAADIARLNEEMAEISSYADIVARLRAKVEDVETRQVKFDSAMTALRPALARALAAPGEQQPRDPSEVDIDPARAPAVCYEALDRERLRLDELTKKLQAAEQELGQIEARAKVQEDALADARAELAEKGDRVREGLAAAGLPAALPFADTLASLEEERTSLRKEVNSADYIVDAYSKFSSRAEKKKCCPLCETAFAPEEGGGGGGGGGGGMTLDGFRRKLKKLIDSAPALVSEVKSALAECERRIGILTPLRADNDRCLALAGDPSHLATSGIDDSTAGTRARAAEGIIMGLESEVASLMEKRTPLAETVRTVRKGLVECRRRHELLADTHRDAQNLATLHEDLERAKRAEQAERRQLDPVGNTRSHAEVRSEYDAKRTEARTLEEAVERRRRRADGARQRAQIADSDYQAAVARRESLRAEEQNTAALRAELGKVEEAIAASAGEIASAMEAVPPLAKVVEKRTAERDALASAHREKVRTARDAADACQRDLDALRGLHVQVRGFALEGTQRRAASMEKSLAAARAGLAHNLTEQDTCRERVVALRSSLADQRDQERNMRDNLALRARRRHAESLETEARELKGSGPDVTEERRALGPARERLKECAAERNVAAGRASRLREERIKLESELRRSEYAKVEVECFELQLQLATLSMAYKDINRYKEGLDKAIMSYHSKKMEEINRILRELWQETYAAGDIDYIEIRSSAEVVGGKTAHKYRVMMVKSGVELELRGRCSAGQKVLASLLIRLALAEAFCVKCGILALDEPTTNLDTHNVELLAQALLNVINQRRRQANFQLLLITHDEEFVRLMSRAGIVDKFYRVRKDPATQFSQITQEDFVQ